MKKEIKFALKMLLITAVALLYASFLQSCKTAKKITETKEFKDSIFYVTKTKIDTVKIKEIQTKTDTVTNEIVLECDSTDFIQKLNTGKTKIKIVKEKGKVRIEYLQNPINNILKSQLEKSIEKNDSIQAVNKELSQKEHETVIVYRIPRWFWILFGVVVFVLLFFRDTLLGLVYKVKF